MNIALYKGQPLRPIYHYRYGYSLTLEELLAIQARHDEAKDCQLELEERQEEALQAFYGQQFTAAQYRLLEMYRGREVEERQAVTLAYWAGKDWGVFQQLRERGS